MLVALIVLACTGTAVAAPFRWSPAEQVVKHPVGQKAGWITGMVCPSANVCIAIDGNGDILSTRQARLGARAWKAVRVLPAADAVSAIACPSVTLCAAVAQNGTLLSSTNPTGDRTAWRLTSSTPFTVPNVVTSPSFSMSCASTTLCVAVNGGLGTVLVSSDPASGAWQSEQIVAPSFDCGLGDTETCGNPITSVDCLGAQSCIAVDAHNDALSSIDPASGADGWLISATGTDFSPSTVDAQGPVACPTLSLCVVPDSEFGTIASAGDAISPQATWQVADVGTDDGVLAALRCPSTTLCVGSLGNGPLLVSTDPASGGWHTVGVGLKGGGAVSCPSISFCAVGGGPSVAISHHPGGGAGAWRRSQVSTDNVSTLVCPNATLCVAGDGRGGIATGSPGRHVRIKPHHRRKHH